MTPAHRRCVSAACPAAARMWFAVAQNAGSASSNLMTADVETPRLTATAAGFPPQRRQQVEDQPRRRRVERMAVRHLDPILPPDRQKPVRRGKVGQVDRLAQLRPQLDPQPADRPEPVLLLRADSVAVAMMPLGWWRMRTPLDVLFRFCPPGPEPRKWSSRHWASSSSSARKRTDRPGWAMEPTFVIAGS